MSYCRMSSDNWRSDVYAYGDCRGGYTTRVADNRIVGEIPPEPPLDFDTEIDDAWMEQRRAVSAFLDTCERRPIGLSCDGAVFNDPDLESFVARLESLQAEGYHVPQQALDRAKEELAEERAASTQGVSEGAEHG